MTETQITEAIIFVFWFLAWSVGIALVWAVYEWKVDREEKKRLRKIRREMNRRVG